MNKNIQYGVRWLMMLPAGIIAVLVTSFMLRVIFQHLFFHLSSAVEAYLVTIINAAVFVMATALVAPGSNESKMNIVLILFSLVVGVFIFLNLTGTTLFGFGIRFNNGWLNLIFAIVGAYAGFTVLPKNSSSLKQQSSTTI